jgi:sugar lactone lactonase YvrE
VTATPASPIVVARAGFPESLRWHDGRLWFSDFRTRNVVSLDASGQATNRAFIPGIPSGLGWSREGELLVVSMADQHLVAVDAAGRRRSVASLAGVAPPGPLNDMVVAPNGTAYIGSTGGEIAYNELTVETVDDVLRPTPLIKVTPDGRVSAASDPIMLANGMVTTADGRLIVVESPTLVAFEIAEDGNLTNRHVFADLTGHGWGIDGIELDSEAAVWVSIVAPPPDGKFLRVKEGGEILDEIPVPHGMPIDCALGGPDGRTLYAGVGYTSRDTVWGNGESESGIEAYRVAVPGRVES